MSFIESLQYATFPQFEALLESVYQSLLLEIKDTKKTRTQLRKVYGDIPDEDIGDIIDRFNQQQARLDQKDIFKYPSLDNLKQEVFKMSQNAAKGRSNTGGRVEFPETPFENAEHLYVDDKVLVVKINSERESKYYGHEVGKKCAWCIAYTDRETYWKSYHEEKGIDFIFVIDSSGDKWAISYKPNTDYVEVYNAADNIRSPLEFIMKYPQIVKPMQDAGVDVKHMKDYKMDDDGKGYVIKDKKMITYFTYDKELRDGVRDNHPAYAILD